MTQKRLSRFTTILATAMLASTLLGVGTAVAGQPGWSISVVKLPPTVSPGADAGFRVTLTNSGPSNIASLYLTSNLAAAPSYVGTPTQGTCNASGPLYCSFGALVAGSSVTVLVAYTTPGSGTSFKVTFEANTTGATTSDSKGKSHGDTLTSAQTVGLSSSKDFAGGFVIGAGTVENDQSVGRRNPQSTSVESPASLVPVTVEDGITTGVPCTVAACSNAFGEWSNLSVAGGAAFGTPFKVTLLVWGNEVPGGVGTGDIVVLHTTDGGSTYVIDTPCTPSTGTPTNAECLTVTKVGSNYKIVVWLFQNGNLRGGF